MTNKLNADLVKQIDSIFAEWDQPGSPGCALAISQDNEIVYERGYGYAQLEYDIPITPDTVFHVASVSKQFTAMAIALLAADGRVDLDASVRKYVPELADFGHLITVRHLVHHVSGLRDHWELVRAAGWRMDDVITTEHLLKMVFRQRELNFEPGAEYLYSNSGYTLMAEIVRRVSGLSLREFADERIFKPLGMNNTHFHDDHEEIVKQRAYSYKPYLPGGWKKSVLSYANVGATSLFTTVRDLTKWLANFSHGKVGGKEVLELVQKPFIANNGETIPYGFGLMLAEHMGWREIGHSGSDAGFRTWCGRVEPHGLGIVILANYATSVPRELARRVAEVILADVAVKPEPQAAPQVNPADFAGTYLVQFFGKKLTITNDGNRLFAKFEGQEREELHYLADTEYEAKEARISFGKAEDGHPTCTWEQRGINMIAKKLPEAAPSADELAAYAGTYYSPELDTTYHIDLCNGELVISHQRLSDTALVPFGTDKFLERTLPGFELSFEREGDEIMGFGLSSPRIRNVRFVKQ